MLGRWQLWHEGHQVLLDRCMEKEEQVDIMIRTMPWGDNNPFSAYEVEKNLREETSTFSWYSINIHSAKYSKYYTWQKSRIYYRARAF